MKRDFYAQMCRVENWATRTLEKKIDSMLFEHTALSRKPARLIEQELTALREEDKLTPDLVFRDPYLLDFLGLKDTYAEEDMAATILREMEAFILELGVGFAFLERQKRITVDGDDYYLDLLFFHRRLRRLVAIELKLGAARLMELVRLRLQAVRKLPDQVIEVLLAAGETAAAPRRERLFPETGGRDLAAANRALARVRAQLGDDAVVRARPRDAHLPEESFAWERLEMLAAATPRLADEPRLVRRIHVHPRPLPPRERHEPDGWMLRGLEQGPVVRALGPYVVSGGWWDRAAHRDYHFAETKGGEILWVFFDRAVKRWFLQGRVE